ncbi:MAG: hypothetical protein NZV14_10325 [Bryobacteraceae bacterium]|nr:hypothetical protein [Bryobacteraceae bacterium]MDW8378548.1 hypothetical protein [Bryobacterales bacterium]
MSDWLRNLREDFFERTVLYPVEAVLLILCVLLFHIPQLKTSPLNRLVRWLHRISRHQLACLPLLFLLALLGASLVDGGAFPPPGVHDEFSYLLAAETFAAGRVTNPPHPMRRYFETIHVLHEPSYMSMYPPAQGFALAIGILLTGQALWGVRLSVAALCAAVYWMLRGWTRPYWALLGGLICAVRIAWFSYWSHSYWGGAVSALGGALLLGAAGRILKEPADQTQADLWRHGFLLGLGALILANSRPFEGSACTVCVLAWVLAKRWGRVPKTVAAGFAITLLSGAIAMCYYNYRITGHPLQPPYLLNRKLYQTHGSFLWEKSDFSKTYSFPELARFYRESEGYPEKLGYWPIQVDKPKRVWFFFLGPVLTLGLLGAASCWRLPSLRLPWLMILLGFFACHLLVRWDIQPHYFGPALGALYVVLGEGFRGLCAWRWPARRTGRTLAAAGLAACFGMAAVRFAAPSLGVKVFQEITYPWYSYGALSNFHRQQVENKLESMPGKHLVLVEYSADHRPEMEWVYNHAQIDEARIVWARYSPEPGRMNPLLDYYRDRKIWWINPDHDPLRVVNYRDILQQRIQK